LRGPLNFGKGLRQFPLQVEFGSLVVFVAEFAKAEFKLQVAQVFVDAGLSFLEIANRRFGSASGSEDG
jgi:hypothetical protein